MHGKDGKILDTLYLNSIKKGMVQLPESKAEIIKMTGSQESGMAAGYDDDRIYYPDIFGVGLVFQQSTKSEVEEYFGKPLDETVTEGGILTKYQYKNSDLYIAFSYFIEDNTLRMVLVDNDFSDCGL